MSEQIILTVFLLLVAGQVIAVMKSHTAGVVYYICVSPVTYFSVWAYLTWDLARVCGLVLILGSIVLGYLRRHAKPQRFARFSILCVYGVAATLIGSRWWPMAGMQDSTAIYNVLRPWVMMFNWLIVFGVSCNIAVALQKADIERLLKPIAIASIVLCSYAILQYVAFNAGHPLTGIRRPAASRLEQTVETEEHAAYALDGVARFRPGSIVGEPKGLGGAIVLWLALLTTKVFYVRVGARWMCSVCLLFITLWLTASTSAFITVILLAPLIWIHGIAQGNRKTATKFQVFLICSMVGGLGLWVINVHIDDPGSFADIWKERVTDRVLTGQELDLAETSALQVLADHPLFLISGCGIGGISMYIAEQTGVTQRLILSPNSGLLANVCDIGFFGILLTLVAMWRGLRIAISRDPNIDGPTKSIAIAGLAAFAQCLVFSQPWLVIVAYGFLLGAEIRTRGHRNLKLSRGAIALTRTYAMSSC